MQISYFVSTDKRNLVNGVCIWLIKRDSQKKNKVLIAQIHLGLTECQINHVFFLHVKC